MRLEHGPWNLPLFSDEHFSDNFVRRIIVLLIRLVVEGVTERDQLGFGLVNTASVTASVDVGFTGSGVT